MSHRIHQQVEALVPEADEHARGAGALIGQTLCDRWHLDALLGIGGMAAVYAATHRNGKRVAVKVLHPELSRNGELRQRFLDEGYAANRVGHLSAVSVLDDGVSDEGAVFLVMDLLEGETLETRIRRSGRLAPREVLLMADSVLDVLAEAHDRQIIHRDVKPDNIFITDTGQLKLLDFGIARMIKPGRPRTTQTGAAMGTPAFMPPEQARGHWEPLDGRTDIWAVGATMFSALTGRQVHEGETTNEELLLAMTQPAVSLGDAAPHLPRALIEIVDRALAFDKEDRWPSARGMQAAVRTAVALVETTMSADGWPPSRRPVQSTSPVALLTAPAAIAGASLSIARRLPKSRHVTSRAAATVLGAVVSVVLLGAWSRVPDRSIEPIARHAQGFEVSPEPEGRMLEVGFPQTSELAAAVPEPAKSGSPIALPRAPAASSTASPTSAHPALALPPAIDPLERRK